MASRLSSPIGLRRASPAHVSATSLPERADVAIVGGGLIGLALFLTRRIYAVFGAIGIAFYLGHLAEKIFKDSLLFPFALSLIGIGVVGAGLLYRRHRDRILSAFEHALPAALRALRPRHALGPVSERSV